jgi:hypothetical protein
LRGGETVRISYALLALRHAVRDFCATAFYNQLSTAQICPWTTLAPTKDQI